MTRPDYVHMNYYSKFGRPRQLASNPNDARQTMLETMYLRVLGELAMNRFKWTGLPESVDTRYLEMNLYFHALAVAFEDRNTGRLLAIKGAPSGQRDFQDNPLSFTLTGRLFTGVTLSARNCVPVWANYFRSPDLDIVTAYAFKLAQIDRTIEINMNNARRARVLVYNENQRLSAENINRQLNNGDPTIRVSMPLGDMIQSFDLGVEPKTIETLSVVRNRLWNECMGLLGINNSNQDKKERLVESEVDANDDQVLNSRYVALNARQAAADEITERYPHLIEEPVRVNYRSDVDAKSSNAALIGMEGDDNGDIHDGTMAGD